MDRILKAIEALLQKEGAPVVLQAIVSVKHED